jgi:predicted metal-dependent phosphoesterase TrpH
MRAITHIHTKHSWDSRLQVASLTSELSKLDVSLALVADHDTFEGSIALARHVSQRDLGIQVPIAAEIRTDQGDVIAVFEDDSDLPAIGSLKSAKEIRSVVIDHGGLVWLPHPYRGHQEVESIAGHCDVVEVFNARCSVKKNERGEALCDAFGATPAYGADAHLRSELGQVIVEYQPAGTLLETLSGKPQPVVTRRTPKSNVMAAEVINGVKVRRPLLAAYFIIRYAKHRSIEAVREVPDD